MYIGAGLQRICLSLFSLALPFSLFAMVVPDANRKSTM